MFDRSAKSSRTRSARVRFGKFTAASRTSGGSSRAQVSGATNEIAATMASAANASDDNGIEQRSPHGPRKEDVSGLSAAHLEQRIELRPPAELYRVGALNRQALTHNPIDAVPTCPCRTASAAQRPIPVVWTRFSSKIRTCR